MYAYMNMNKRVVRFTKINGHCFNSLLLCIIGRLVYRRIDMILPVLLLRSVFFSLSFVRLRSELGKQMLSR